jgi:hypothetical protein
MALRRIRQQAKRDRDRMATKLVQLERVCDRLTRELREAEYAFRDAWANRAQLEDQNRRMLEMLTRAEMLKPPAPIIVSADLAEFINAQKKGG